MFWHKDFFSSKERTGSVGRFAVLGLCLSVFLNLVLGTLYYFEKTSSPKITKGYMLMTSKGMSYFDFFHDFFHKVIIADKEISFDDRLVLENAIRALNDEETLGAWRSFTNAKTSKETESALKILMDRILDRIK